MTTYAQFSVLVFLRPRTSQKGTLRQKNRPPLLVLYQVWGLTDKRVFSFASPLLHGECRVRCVCALVALLPELGRDFPVHLMEL